MRGPTPRFYFAPNATWTTLDAAISWEEITDYVMSERGAGGQRGRSSELDDMRAGTFNCTLDNTDRRFDPMHTGSPYYATYLNLTGASGSSASTPDVAALDITGDIDLRARCSIDDLTPSVASVLVAKWTTTGNQRSYRLDLNTDGTLRMSWSADGITGLAGSSTVTVESVGITAGQTVWLRGTLDVNNGAAGRDVKLWYSLDTTNDHSLVSWTQLGATVTTAGVTSVFSSTSTVEAGANTDGTLGNLTGKIYAAAVLNGIGGTVVADPVFSIGLGVGATSVTDSTGKVWTVNSPATITGTSSYLKPGVPFKVTGTANSTEYPVLRGFIGGWPQDYDVSNRLAFVNLSVTDGMAKLATAGTPSSVYAIEVAADAPKIWYRLAETIGSGLTDSSGNKYDSTWNTALSRPTTVAHPNQWETAGQVPVLASEDWAHTGDPAAPVTRGTGMTVEFMAVMDSETPAEFRYVFYQMNAEATGNDAFVQTSPTGKVSFKAAGAVSVYSTDVEGWRDDTPHIITCVLEDGVLPPLTYIDGVSQPVTSTLSVSSTTATGLWFHRSAWVSATDNDGQPGAFADFSIHEVNLSEARVLARHAAFLAPWDGDTTGERIDRILGFGWPSDLIDTASGFTVLGPATLGQNQLQLIKSYEKAEQGRFFISRDGKATFLDRYYNQLETEGSVSQATFSDDGSDNAYCSIAFDYDDRLVYNRVRASRTGGGTIEVFDQDSIDTYGEQVDSSLTSMQVGTDAVVRGGAELRLDRYKQPALRVRPVELKLHGLTAAQQADVLGLELGYRVTVERTPQGVGSAISQETVVEGISHRISGGQWTTTLTLSPVDTREYGLWGDNWGEALWGY